MFDDLIISKPVEKKVEKKVVASQNKPTVKVPVLVGKIDGSFDVNYDSVCESGSCGSCHYNLSVNTYNDWIIALEKLYEKQKKRITKIRNRKKEYKTPIIPFGLTSSLFTG